MAKQREVLRSSTGKILTGEEVMRTITYSETEKFRESIGFYLHEEKKRHCLKCDVEFVSFGKTNRVCHSCRNTSVFKEDNEAW